MTTGTIKFFNSAKKFGFLTSDDGGKDLYLPASAIPAADVTKLKMGLRVSFDRVPDPKGDKAANLKLLEEKPVAAPASRQSLTIYLDPATPEAHLVEAAVRARNHLPMLIDYTATPLTVDQLKRLATLLGAAGQNLVHRYHPIFLELRLDDRFISEGEYWTAVAENPTLINGPIVVADARASICKSQKDVAALFNEGPVVEAERKPKQISARIAAMMSGQAAASLPKEKATVVSAPKTPSTAVRKAMSKPVVRATKAKPAAKPQKIKIGTTVKNAAPKTAAKKLAKKPAKRAAKPAAKVPKKSRRSAKAKKNR